MSVRQEKDHSFVIAPSVENLEIPSRYRAARHLVESHLGEIRQANVVAGGLVSHVYKVFGENQKGIVKVRGTHLAQLPDIPIDPQDSDYEWTALHILSTIEPYTFPHPLAFDRDTSMILMTDVMPDGETLKQRLEKNSITNEELHDLGSTVARVHKKLQPYSEPIRVGGDESVYNTDLSRRLGYISGQDNSIIDDVVSEVNALPKQLILGDLAPKNIGQGDAGQITICDLESFYQGNLVFAYGYLAGHILLHTVSNNLRSESALNNLISGYQSEDTTTDFDSMLLKKVTLGAALYRLHNTAVPYDMPLSSEEKSQKAHITLDLLSEDSFSWSNLIGRMTSS